MLFIGNIGKREKKEIFKKNLSNMGKTNEFSKMSSDKDKNIKSAIAKPMRKEPN